MAAREAEGGDLMTAAELRPVLTQSKRKPVSCAVGLTKDKQAAVLLDRKMKPRKLMAEFKGRAKGAGLELDMTSVRFGRVALLGEDGTASFTVNKAAPKAMEAGLTRKLRPAGVRKVEIGVDAGLEDEDDAEDGQDSAGAARDADGRGAAPGNAGGPGAAGDVAASPGPIGGEAASAGGSPGPAGGRAAQGGMAQGGPAADGGNAGPDEGGAEGAGADGPAGRGTPGMQASPAGASPRNDATDGPAGVPAGADPRAGAPGRAAVARRLAMLVRRMTAALPGNPPGAAAMRAAAMAGQAAMKSGDMAAAGQAADMLERLLGGADRGRAGGDPSSGAAQTDASGDPTVGGSSPTSAAAAAGKIGPRPADAMDGQAMPSEAPVPPVNAQAVPARSGPAREDGSARMFAKGCQAWRATRAKVESDIEAVIKQVAGEHGPGGDEADVVRKAFGPLIHKLDDRLAAKLDEAAKAGDSAMHNKLARDAQGIIQEYQAFIDTSPLVAQLDQNPYHRVSVRHTLDTALAALSRAVNAKAGQGTVGEPA